MARAFVRASSHYLEFGGAALTGVPLSMACWFNSDNIAVGQTLLSLANSATSGTDEFRLDLRGDVANDPVRATTGGSSADTSVGYSANTWQHACAVFGAINSRAAYLNGGSKGTNASSVTPAGINRTAIGRISRSVPTFFMSGMIAEAAIWSVALTDADAAALAVGLSPLLVRPESLVAYWPLIGRNSPENDRIGDFPLTVNGPTVADHCRIIRARAGFRLGVPSVDYAETVRAQTILAALGRTDLAAFSDAARAQSVLAALGGTDLAAWSDLSKAQAILALTGGEAGWTTADALEQIILAVTGSNDSRGQYDAELAQTILALMGQTDAYTQLLPRRYAGSGYSSKPTASGSTH